MYLNTGQSMPTLGLGTFDATEPGEVKAAVKAAVNAGYRLIDCAAGYGNQSEVGEAISELIGEGVVTRDELFVVSKLFQTHRAAALPVSAPATHGPARARARPSTCTFVRGSR